MSEEVEEGFDMSLLDPKADFEPPQDEVVEEEAEVVEDVVDEVEQPELPVDDDLQSDQKPEHNDLMDKEVQKLQQLRATYEREIGKLQNAPTERQVERVEKAKTKLDKYLEATDVDPYQGVTDIAEEVMADRGRVEQVLQQFEAERRAAEEREIRRESEMAQMRFNMDFPELKGQYNDIAQKVNDSLMEQLGDDLAELPPQAYVKLANREFMRLAKDAVGQAKPVDVEPTPPIEDTAKKPKAAKIIPKQNGTKVESAKDSIAVGEDLIASMHKEMFGA